MALSINQQPRQRRQWTLFLITVSLHILGWSSIFAFGITIYLFATAQVNLQVKPLAVSGIMIALSVCSDSGMLKFFFIDLICFIGSVFDQLRISPYNCLPKAKEMVRHKSTDFIGAEDLLPLSSIGSHSVYIVVADYWLEPHHHFTTTNVFANWFFGRV